jgi:ABC-type transporter Mla MlaB component
VFQWSCAYVDEFLVRRRSYLEAMDKRDGEVLRCEVAGVAADAAALDALARLALLARRHGCELQICGASQELRALIAFAGLADVLRE